MANIKSAKKRILVSAKKQARNKHVKSTTKTAIKKLTLAANAGNKDALQSLYVQAVSAIDKAASKGVYHKNTASRKKSVLARMVNRTTA